MFSTVMVRICRSKKCSCPLEPSVGSPTRKGFDRKGTAWWSCSLLRPWCLRVLSRVVKQKAMMIILGMWLDFLKCPSNGTIAVEAITSGSRMGQSHSPSCFETSNHQLQAQILVAWNTSCIYEEGAPAHLLLLFSSCFFHMFFNVFPWNFKVLLLHVVIAWRDCPSQHPLPNCYGFSIFLDKSMETMPLTQWPTLLCQTINPSIKSGNLVSHDAMSAWLCRGSCSWITSIDTSAQDQVWKRPCKCPTQLLCTYTCMQTHFFYSIFHCLFENVVFPIPIELQM